MFSVIWAQINDWVNNREAGDLRRRRGHYDVNVMFEKCVQMYDGMITWSVYVKSNDICALWVYVFYV